MCLATDVAVHPGGFLVKRSAGGRTIRVVTAWLFLLASGARAAEDLTVYQINPTVDAVVIGTATMATLLPRALDANLIDRRCPCDPAEVNSLDRPVIGNANAFLDNLSD